MICNFTWSLVPYALDPDEGHGDDLVIKRCNKSVKQMRLIVEILEEQSEARGVLPKLTYRSSELPVRRGFREQSRQPGGVRGQSDAGK